MLTKSMTALLVSAIVVTAAASAAERPSDRDIRELVAENLRATQAGDADAILLTIHPESQAQTTIAPGLEMVKAYKLKYEATSVAFVAMSGEYALVRIMQKTIRVAGPDFLDNEIDGLWALKKDGTKWKYWTQMAFTLRPLAQPPSPGQ